MTADGHTRGSMGRNFMFRRRRRRRRRGLGRSTVTINKVKAHATRAQRAEMGARLWVGNTAADKHAKLGAQMLQHADWQRKAYIEKFKLVSDILEFAARVGGESHEIKDTSREKARTPPEPEGPPDEVPPSPPPPPPRSLPLLVEEVDGDPRDPS